MLLPLYMLSIGKSYYSTSLDHWRTIGFEREREGEGEKQFTSEDLRGGDSFLPFNGQFGVLIVFLSLDHHSGG